MTVETTTSRVTYTGAGTTGPFSVPFYFLEDDDLTVIKTTIDDGTETTLVLTTDYTVSGAADEAGGSVTLTASLSNSYKLTIIRDPDMLQGTDYPANDRFPATTHERVVDKLTMIAQRLKDLINRSFRLSDGDVSGISLSLSNLSASKLIAVNSAGTALEAVAAADVGLTPVSDFAATLLDDADADAARITLGAASLTANTFTGIQRWAKGADVASANALTLGTDGNYFDITGTTAITSIGTLGVGTVVKLHFDGALTLTHHATDLVLPGAANITTAAGDEAEFVEYATGNWRCTNYTKANAAVTTSGITMSTARLLGRTTASTGAVEEITVGSGLSLSAGSLTTTGSGITLGTPVASTSGTSIDFTSIPAGTKRITINFGEVSTSGTSPVVVQLGDSGGVETTGYVGASGLMSTGGANAYVGVTSSIPITYSATTAANTIVGTVTLTLLNSSTNKWEITSNVFLTSQGYVMVSAGNKSLSAELDRVRITTVGGSDTFDAGEINITYE